MTHHSFVSPFPRMAGGARIIDERCACGHYRSIHEDNAGWGHGQCTFKAVPCDARPSVSPCTCPQFTWVSHVVEKVA